MIVGLLAVAWVVCALYTLGRMLLHLENDFEIIAFGIASIFLWPIFLGSLYEER